MLQHKGYKYRIYPSAEQQRQLASLFGCRRFVYNYFLELRQKTYKEQKRNVSKNECMRLLTQLKKGKEYAWLNGVDSMALQEAVKDLDRAYQNFFEKRAKYPRFARRRHEQTYRTRNQADGIRIEDCKLRLPTIGFVKVELSRQFNGRILNVTVTKTATNKYYVSLCVEEEIEPKPNGGGVIGIDLGIKEFYTDNCGDPVHAPKALKKRLKKLRREQRRLSRKREANTKAYVKKGKGRKPIFKRPLRECKNYQKQRCRVAAVHEKVANCRSNFIHRESTKLVRENQTIAVESLNIKGMMRNRKLSRAIADVSWGTFVRTLEYKAFEYGCTVIRIPTFFPSSQTCSNCGYKNAAVKDLKVRKWECPVCGMLHDRDTNAAINILNKALETLIA